MDILQTGMYQIDRIEHFTENMRKMSHLEQRELQCSEIVLSELAKKIETEAVMLSKKESKLCKVESVQEQNVVKMCIRDRLWPYATPKVNDRKE